MQEERQRGLLEEYWLDAWQRSILFLDILRQRGNTYVERTKEIAPNVLRFDGDVVIDGRTLDPPVNYALVLIEALADKPTDPAKAPFIVVDPRAGHGPGIGGMKAESEIGVALQNGHPCYFVGFLPEPVPGQTVEDVCRAEAAFVAEVAARHPDASKPVIIANCQAGWQIMMMAAVNPDLAGPILLAGSPLSYWAGVHGKNPMRYLGGVMGGTWMASLAGDLGGGIFDGAHLVRNFESLDPANTYWEKPYNVYSKVDTEAARFLDFETWWGSPVLLNAEEMQWITDNLFIGNKLSSGALRTSDGIRIDLRNVKSPIIVFCSYGDNITPPQQALGWITDLYEDESEIIANGQTIVYALHESVGHLGIFVSGKVASKEHSEILSCMEMIEIMPPGLYEAVISDATPDMKDADLIEGRYLFTLEARRLDDIRAIGDNSAEDDLSFSAAARVSDVNRSFYDTYAKPWLQQWITPPAAEAMRRMHPNRLRFAIFSDENPMMRAVEQLAEKVREERQPVSTDNPLLAAEKRASDSISTWLRSAGELRDAWVEAMFFGVYGSPWLRASVGMEDDAPPQRRRVERDLIREARDAQNRLQLEKRFESGDLGDAVVRSLLYVRGPSRAVDERDFAMLRLIHAEHRIIAKDLGPTERRAQLTQQMLLLQLDTERAVNGIAKLLPASASQRGEALDLMRRVATRHGELIEEAENRWERIEALFSDSGRKAKSGVKNVAGRSRARVERSRQVSAPH